MSPSEKTAKRRIPAPIRLLIRPLQGKAWLVASTLTFSIVFVAGAVSLWRAYQTKIMAQPQYRLDPKRLVVTPQPAWIHSDVVATALTSGQLLETSLLETEYVLQVRQAFAVQPWVKRVIRVNKRFPSTVEVDLEYRRPIALVEVPAGLLPPYDYEGLLPVDQSGVLLPVEMSEEEAAGYPKITGVDTSPAGPPGTAWGDERVKQAAEIVGLLEDLWEPLELYQIEVPRRRHAGERVAGGAYVLITKKRRRFEWGNPPGKESADEERAEEKITRLKRFLQEFGPLDALQLTDHRTISQRVGLRYDGQRPIR